MGRCSQVTCELQAWCELGVWSWKDGTYCLCLVTWAAVTLSACLSFLLSVTLAGVQNEQFTGAAVLATQELSQSSRWTFEVDVAWFSKMLAFPWGTRACSKIWDQFSILVAGSLKPPIGSSSQCFCPWFGPLGCSDLWMAPECLLGRFSLKLIFGDLTWNK